MTDNIGNRMKSNYENITRFYLPRRTYTIIRIDGKAFHTLTRNAKKPYDSSFMTAMDRTTIGLCNEIQGVEFAYTQSDEISLLLTDFETVLTTSWFDGNIQKMASVSASIAAAHFNSVKLQFSNYHPRLGYFDSRVFTIPDPTEVANYFVWRQQDASRNSIQMLGQAHFSPKDLHCKPCSTILDMLWVKGIDYSAEPTDFRLGRFFEKVMVTKDVEYTHKKTGEIRVVEGAIRHEWQKAAMPLFVEDRQWLKERIPMYD